MHMKQLKPRKPQKENLRLHLLIVLFITTQYFLKMILEGTFVFRKLEYERTYLKFKWLHEKITLLACEVMLMSLAVLSFLAKILCLVGCALSLLLVKHAVCMTGHRHLLLAQSHLCFQEAQIPNLLGSPL